MIRTQTVRGVKEAMAIRGEAYKWKSERIRGANKRKGFETVQDAFCASSNGQFAPVTWVDVNRLPINPKIRISSTSLKRRPAYQPEG